MQKRKLGNTDLDLTTVGLGTWAMGGPWQFGWGPQDDDEAIAAILAAIETDINWIDTAPIYGLGHAEELVGKALNVGVGGVADVHHADVRLRRQAVVAEAFKDLADLLGQFGNSSEFTAPVSRLLVPAQREGRLGGIHKQWLLAKRAAAERGMRPRV